MRAILVLAFLAGAVVIGTGCGSGSGSISVTGTTTIESVKTGTPVICKGGPGAGAPRPGHGVTGVADGAKGSSPAQIQLTRRLDGSLVAACSR